MVAAFANAANAVPDAPLPHIDTKRAFQYTREVTAFGPRYIGSENHKKLERYIVDHLKGDQVEDDAFTADTPKANFPSATSSRSFRERKTASSSSSATTTRTTRFAIRDMSAPTMAALPPPSCWNSPTSCAPRHMIKSVMDTASGSFGPTAKKPSRPGPTRTASMALAISPKNGRRTAR